MVNDADAALETNAYAISYRLLGDRPSARAVAGIAAERVRQLGGMGRPDWLYLLVEYTLEKTVGPGAMSTHEDPADPFAGLRTALRRRLERATPDERVAGSLLQLAGYPPDFVAGVVRTDAAGATALAQVIAPPPGVEYRDLGDPELTRRDVAAPLDGRRRRRPHWTTIAAISVVVAAILAATQITGPRPTLGPEIEEGMAAVESSNLSGTADRSPS
ncbi:MAG: hypothetical protein ACK4V6_13125 [Microthrixaceae bacterium]